MKIGELVRKVGFSAHTLRYYEKIGLLPAAARKSGVRDYGDETVIWLAFISRLRATGMPLAEMIAYAELRAKGASTLAARRDLLMAHRKRVKTHVALLQESLSVLDKKVSTYAAELRKIKTYES